MRGWRTALALFVALLALVGLAALAQRPGPLERAQTAWAARSFTAYQASIVHTYQIGDFLPSQHRCTMTVEVRLGAAPTLIAGDCAEPLSVEAILIRFAPYTGAPLASRWCGYGGCTCALSTLRVERDVGRPYPRRIVRDWRDATVGTGPGWAWLARVPAPLRAAAQDFAEQRNPCPPGTGNHTLEINPIYREEFQILSEEPLP